MNAFMMAVFNTVMGMGTVFVVLIFISLIISLFVYIPAAQEKLRSVFGHSKEENIAEEETVPEIPEVEEENLINDEELVAVLMAAIAASSEGAVSADKLIVRSVRRVKRRYRNQ